MLLLLAKPNPPLNNDTVSPGLLGFAVFLALCVAVFFLVRSMNKQIGKIQAPSEADLKQAEWDARDSDRESVENGQKD